MHERNEAAVSLAWLSMAAGLSPDNVESPVQQAWLRVSKEMLACSKTAKFRQWPSDMWIARSASEFSGSLLMRWEPPEKVYDWPTFGVRGFVRPELWQAKRTNNASMTELLAFAKSPDKVSHLEALAEFTQLREDAKDCRDPRMAQVNQIRAWLTTALGALLAPIAFVPSEDSSLLVAEALRRLQIPVDFVESYPKHDLLFDVYEDQLELLYDLQIGPKGIVQTEVRSGQSEEWREHWTWLSRTIGTEEMVLAAQIAAQLLRCAPLLEALLQAVRKGEDNVSVLALAVLRRWLLTLNALMWLEDALAHSWNAVRPQDLACFAFSALKPEWPRRLIALSHRSADAKAILMGMKLWRLSGRCAIDATYVPAWETNTGMVWALFAPTPAIVRIHSQGYSASGWCRRESELIEYLCNRGDFLSERWVLDVDIENLSGLDEIADTLAFTRNKTSRDKLEYPSWGNYVWMDPPLLDWESAMLKGIAILRIVNGVIRDPKLTNTVVEQLLAGNTPPIPPITNHPGGWIDYGFILRRLNTVANKSSRTIPLRIPEKYTTSDTRRDIEALQWIPDLSSNVPALEDVLAAIEWRRTIWPTILEDVRNPSIVIDCREVAKGQWERSGSMSVMRGISSLRMPVPVWFLQKAEQEIDTWPLVGERPIFTEHTSGQFSWMLPVTDFFWPSWYHSECNIEMCEDLRDLCQRRKNPLSELDQD